ncbi:hypothetical protein OM076_07825 [Solirubrobacter ginsenosidimutans]|uniref:Bacterial transcriptional activator domain-containing protein n=1 Tax=Solirubrobacter ginsenosidimutans TaxID=490573 RepID=A0A9X3MQT5_9ACTN|nr:BTAD domain-containing putative transcriptional regulator [Solirubrobacter ginsenosidimutans]MDA0160166.1 hypothetical protein [Solirubrobacter ginsenosidimutans]
MTSAGEVLSASASNAPAPIASVGLRLAPDPAREHRALGICLLGGFRLVLGGSVMTLSLGAQRLVAFVALQHGAVRRDLIAGLLWPAVSEGRAHASLRSGLARLGDAASCAIAADGIELALAADVEVDLVEARQLAHRLLEPGSTMTPAMTVRAIPLLAAELLPGWYEDWTLLEVESWRQLRLHALEAAAGLLVVARRFGDAADAAVAAVRVDPLRESARSALIGVHLAEGNQSEALREFERFRVLLDEELGLAPTSTLHDLLP